MKQEQIQNNIDYLRRRENKLIADLEKEHQVVDAQELVLVLKQRATFQKILDN